METVNNTVDPSTSKKNPRRVAYRVVCCLLLALSLLLASIGLLLSMAMDNRLEQMPNPVLAAIVGTSFVLVSMTGAILSGLMAIVAALFDVAESK
jgi:hypothetical protein